MKGLHPALTALMQKAVPSAFYSAQEISNVVLEPGEQGEKSAWNYLRYNLSRSLSDYVVKTKIISLGQEGQIDKSCFEVERDHYKESVRFQVRLHVLTPAELETLMVMAFEKGQTFGR